MAEQHQQRLPTHLAFDTNTLSFLYSHDMKLLDIRSVPLKKLFCVRLSPRTMSFLHDQVHRVADAMLDSAFLFIKQQDGEGAEAYCLSHPSWGPARRTEAATCEDDMDSPVNNTTTPETPSLLPSPHASSSSSTETAPPHSSSSSSYYSALQQQQQQQRKQKRMKQAVAATNRHPPSTLDLRRHGFLRRITSEEQVRAAFQAFLDSPKVHYACDHAGADEDLESQNKRAAMIDSVVGKQLPDASSMSRMSVDGRRVGVPVECTLATYSECFDSGWMGEMILQGVVNMPYERYFVPVEVSDRNKLMQTIMLEARIFNLHVQQQCSRLILGRPATCQTIHRFAEGNLCTAPAASCGEEVAWLH